MNENPAEDRLPFQAPVTHYWDYWELRNRYWWATAAAEKGRYSQTPEGPWVGQGSRLWKRDLHAESFWNIILGIHTYEEVKEKGLDKGRKWIEIYLQKRIQLISWEGEKDGPSDISYIRVTPERDSAVNL